MDYVADNIRLGTEEEKVLRCEGNNGDDNGYRGGGGGGGDGGGGGHGGEGGGEKWKRFV